MEINILYCTYLYCYCTYRRMASPADTKCRRRGRSVRCDRGTRAHMLSCSRTGTCLRSCSSACTRSRASAARRTAPLHAKQRTHAAQTSNIAGAESELYTFTAPNIVHTFTSELQINFFSRLMRLIFLIGKKTNKKIIIIFIDYLLVVIYPDCA